MASPVNAALCATVAVAFWSLLGYAISCRLLPRPLACGTAPVLGWAVHSAAALPVFFLIGFSPVGVVAVGVLCAFAAAGSVVAAAKGSRAHAQEPEPSIPIWAWLMAAVLALEPAIALLPKFTADGVHLAGPIYDHSKIAIVDSMRRLGLPPVNPVFGEGGAPGRLAYYYLWHLSAAELALVLDTTGWEADIGLTWFTALASLALMMGLAVWFSNRAGAAFVAVALAAAASVRAIASSMFAGFSTIDPLAPPTGFEGWLFQSAWAPQHIMSASCAVTAMLLVARSGERQSVLLLLVLALTVTAGFESSAYVGGITFAIAALVAAPFLIHALARERRWRFAAGLILAGVLAIGLSAPFVIDQWSSLAARGDGNPIGVHPFEVLGTSIPASWRRILDLPAYWLVLLPIEFPAAYVAGGMALAVLVRNAPAGLKKLAMAPLVCLTVVGLFISWLLASRIGFINDLGLRAVLPPTLILTAAAAAGVVLRPRRGLIVVTAITALALSLFDAANITCSNFFGDPAPDEGIFAQAPQLWSAVRKYASPTTRVANNPLFLQDLTPWPANMSWALLADRSSCFAGRELALVFAPLSRQRRESIDDQFVRVFNGKALPGDVDDMARKYACDVVVVVPQDQAWTNDPFASSPDYRLAENAENRWRIYLKVPAMAK